MNINNCEWCQIPYTRGTKETKRDWAKRKYCSYACSNLGRQDQTLSLNPPMCQECHSRLELKVGMRRSDLKRKKFCSQSCSTKFNNRARAKPTLNVNLTKPPIQACNSVLANRTKGEVKPQKVHHHARMVMRGKPRCCAYCGYYLFVDVAHIKPVRAFSSCDPLSLINAEDNLVFLCPNHHQEFDAGLLSLGDIMGRDIGTDPMLEMSQIPVLPLN